MKALKKVSVLILALLLLALPACGKGVTLAEDELSGVFEQYPEELEYMEQMLDIEISSIDESTFRDMQRIATTYMSSMPELDISGLITDLSVMRFERGAE